MSTAVFDGDEDVLILLGILTAQMPDLPCGRVDRDRVGVVMVVRLAHEHRLKPGKVWLALRNRDCHRQRRSTRHGHRCCALKRGLVVRLPHDREQRSRCEGFGRDFVAAASIRGAESSDLDESGLTVSDPLASDTAGHRRVPLSSRRHDARRRSGCVKIEGR
jgi:hypothetical protein